MDELTRLAHQFAKFVQVMDLLNELNQAGDCRVVLEGMEDGRFHGHIQNGSERHLFFSLVEARNKLLELHSHLEMAQLINEAE